MKKTTVIVFSVISIILLTGISLAATLVLQTKNSDFRNDPDFYRSLADELAKQGSIPEAISAYEMCLELKEDYEVRNNLAVLYYRIMDYDNAMRNLRILVEFDPSNPSYHYDLAVNLVDKFRNTEDKHLEDLYEALSEYEVSEELSPGFQNAKSNAAIISKVLSEV
ncbi:hypothetical protein JW711_03210 [Candidatus Woesearchaeota archaeon]|nr:hypothetical protein [Candidatus Woesearchaeota archaeon]